MRAHEGARDHLVDAHRLHLRREPMGTSAVRDCGWAKRVTIPRPPPCKILSTPFSNHPGMRQRESGREIATDHRFSARVTMCQVESLLVRTIVRIRLLS